MSCERKSESVWYVDESTKARTKSAESGQSITTQPRSYRTARIRCLRLWTREKLADSTTFTA